MLIQLMILVLSGCGKKDQAKQDASPPVDLPSNVLLVLIDDVGIDKLTSYGAEYASHTPTIDALATQGIRFDNVYAAPLCSPARAQLMTGRHARRTGMGYLVGQDNKHTQLPLEALTIPEALALVPGPTWDNAAFGKWHLAGKDSPNEIKHPNDQGFSHFDGMRGNPPTKAPVGFYRWRRVINGRASKENSYLTTTTTTSAVRRINKLKEPWFMYVPYNAAHVPMHIPPPELLREPIPKGSRPRADQQFDAMVEALDKELGRLLDAMDPELRARTTVIVMGDNGSAHMSFPRDAGIDKRRVKGSLFEAGVRVPMIITGPHVSAPGTTEDALVHITDLFPTILEIAGVPTEDGVLRLGEVERELDGRSLLPLLRGEEGGHDYIYAERFQPNGAGPYELDLRSVRNRTHLLIRGKKKDHLFRLQGDLRWDGSPNLLSGDGPTEQADVQAHVELVAELERQERALKFEGF